MGFYEELQNIYLKRDNYKHSNFGLDTSTEDLLSAVKFITAHSNASGITWNCNITDDINFMIDKFFAGYP